MGRTRGAGSAGRRRVGGRHPVTEARLRSVWASYGRRGTLAAVGRELGLTRERVRQLLRLGTAAGLFVYAGRRRAGRLSREQLVARYRAAGSWRWVARGYRVSMQTLRRWVAESLAQDEKDALRREVRRARALAAYEAIRAELGRHPSTTELERHGPWRSVYVRICRLWGSFRAFRVEQDIPWRAVGRWRVQAGRGDAPREPAWLERKTTEEAARVVAGRAGVMGAAADRQSADLRPVAGA